MSRNLPTLSYKKLLKIVLRHCDGPLHNNGGSHQKYQSRITGKKFTFGKRRADFQSALVKKILTQDIGLTMEQAREEVEK